MKISELGYLNFNSGKILDRGSAYYNSSFINGEDNISDFSGNLTLGHSMEINFPNDLKTSLTLTYNANASYSYIEDLVANKTKDHTFGDHLGGRETNVNAPGWIFAINGIAIQTVNFEGNFFVGPQNGALNYEAMPHKPISGTAVPLLNPGYHYTNEIKFMGFITSSMERYSKAYPIYPTDGDNPDPGANIRDCINIMNGEGNVIRLFNPKKRDCYTPLDNNTAPFMIGAYFDSDNKTSGYAIVEWKNGETLAERKIYYKPGNGLTYYFEEEFAKYEGWTTDTANYKEFNRYYERGTNPPRIAYLKEIRSPNGDKLIFNYDYNAFGLTFSNGRKFFKSITYCNAAGTKSTEAKITFDYVKSGSVYKIDIQNLLSSESYTIELNNYNTYGVNNITRDTTGSLSNTMLVSKIINNRDTEKYSAFNYDIMHTRKYWYSHYRNYEGATAVVFQWDYFLKYPIRLLTGRRTNKGEKNEYTYWVETELNGDTLFDKRYNPYTPLPGMEGNLPDDPPIWYVHANGYYTNAYSLNPTITAAYILDESYPNYLIFKAFHQGNMTDAARDNYTTTMIKSAKYSVYENENHFKDIKKTEYKYSWNDSLETGSFLNNTIMFNKTKREYYDLSPCIYNILTEIKTLNLTDDTSSVRNSFTQKKYFDELRVSTKKFITDYPKEGYMLNNEIKLVEESLYDNNGNELYRTIYDYDKGKPSINQWAFYRSYLYYYNIRDLDNINIKSKKYYVGDALKATITYDYTLREDPYMNLFNVTWGDTLHQNYYTSIKETAEGSYAGAYAKSARKIQTFDNTFVPTTIGTASQIVSDTNFVFLPTLDSVETIEGKPNASSNTWTRKSKKVNIYYTDDTKRQGKLKTETLYGKTDDRGVTTTYDYYTSGTNPGFLKSVTTGGLTTTYQYNAQVTSATGTMRDFTGNNMLNISRPHTSFQSAPFKTTRSFTNPAGTAVSFISYSAFDGKNNLKFGVDENGYYFSNAYDPIGRILYEFKPGSYHPSQDLFDDVVNHEFARYNYVDNLWVPEVTKYSYVDNTQSSYVASKSYFVPTDLMYVNSALSGTTEIPKSKEKLNYLGKKIYTEDGMQRKAYYYYDNFLNLSETRFTSNLSTAPKQQQILEYGNDPAYFKRIKLVDENGKYQYNYYDLFGNVIKNVKGNPGLTTEFTYNEINQLTSVKTPANKTTSYVYDDLGYVSQKTSPDEGTYRYKYDKYGNLRYEFHTGTSQLVYHMYDALNRLTATGLQSGFSSDAFNDLDPDIYDNASFSEGSPTNWVIKNMYDAFSRTGNFTDAPSLTISDGNFKGRLAATGYRDKTTNAWSYKVYDYDALGNIDNFYQSFEGGAVKTIANKYDNLGNLTYQNIDSKYYTWYKYDNQGRLIKCLSDPFGTESAANVDARYAYNNADQVTGLASLNGSTIADSLKYTYNTRSWVSQILRNGNSFVENLTYEANGNIYTQGITNTANSWSGLSYTYTYDAYNRLTASAFTPTLSESYTYNADGAITSKNRTNMNITYTYPAANNKLSGISVNGTAYALSYDARGNFLSNAYSKTYLSNYDRRNLPLKESGQYAESILYYDDNGNRIGKFYSSMGGAVNKEYYLRDHTGRELAIYDQVTGKIKFINLYGIGLIGRAEIY